MQNIDGNVCEKLTTREALPCLPSLFCQHFMKGDPHRHTHTQSPYNIIPASEVQTFQKDKKDGICISFSIVKSISMGSEHRSGLDLTQGPNLAISKEKLLENRIFSTHPASSIKCATHVHLSSVQLMSNSDQIHIAIPKYPLHVIQNFSGIFQQPHNISRILLLVLFPIYWYDLLLPPLSLPSVAPHFNMIYILPFPRKNSSHVSYLHLSMPVREKSILMFPCVVGSNILKSSAQINLARTPAPELRKDNGSGKNWGTFQQKTKINQNQNCFSMKLFPSCKTKPEIHRSLIVMFTPTKKSRSMFQLLCRMYCLVIVVCPSSSSWSGPQREPSPAYTSAPKG